MAIKFAEPATLNTTPKNQEQREIRRATFRYVYYAGLHGEGQDSYQQIEVVRNLPATDILIDHQTRQAIWCESAFIVMPD